MSAASRYEMRALLIALVGCTTHKPPVTALPTTCADITIVDERGTPLPGATVAVERRTRACGPSMLPEGCSTTVDAQPLTTNRAGRVTACGPSRRDDVVVARYRDWPRARAVPAQTITLGPPRTAFASVPGCADAQVIAYGPGDPVRGALRDDGQIALAGLGPWQYTVRSERCQGHARIVDVRHLPAVIVLDGSDAQLGFPALAGGTVTVREQRSDAALATTTLDADGNATLALPGDAAHVYCARIETADRCMVTFLRAGDVTRPETWQGRLAEVEASCGRCPTS